ncbi:CD48 antigen isoform X2 [Perognathus longimembris pacificus]|uniref:CD48 antigen isoform X2 n=1 Tax=Perognathus longimembris pacificus TaxID=214514 RepID=UPI002019E382|nr:CD48 antigen isoform X2 [Perognathus longimembris pacificus]
MYSTRRNWLLALDLLLTLLVTSMQDTSEPDKIVLSGSNVTLQISKGPPGNATHVTWLYTTNQKIVEHNPNIPPKYFNSVFKDRVKLDLQSNALHIYHVQKSDSGTYYFRILKNGEEMQWEIPLKVLDPVLTPIINIEKTEELDGNCYLRLSCVVNQSADYLWYKDSVPFPKELQRNTLEATVTPQNQSKSYSCQVSNLLSSKNDTVYFTPPCTLARSTGVKWMANWLAVMMPTILGLLLISDELF